MDVADADRGRSREELWAEVLALRAEVEALRRSEGLLREVVEALDDPVFAKDGAGRYVLANAATGRVWGLPAAEFLGKADFELLPAAQARRFTADDRSVAEGGGPATFEEVVDGRTYLTTKAARRGGGVIGQSRDVTGRAAAEAALSRQKELLQTIFDHIPVMLTLIAPDGRFLMVNKEWERSLGWTGAEAYDGAVVAAMYPAPEDRRAVFEAIHRPAGTWAEYRTRTRDGRVLDTTWANVLLSDGTSIGIGLDVTARKAGEASVRARERLFRAVFEGALDAMVLADDQGRYVDANPAACDLFGLPRDRLLGRTVAEFAVAEYDAGAAWQEFRAAGHARHGTFRLARPDGTTRETEYAATPDVLPGYHLSVLRDVTERERAAAALRRSERRFRHVLEHSRDVIYQVNLATNTVDYISPSVREVMGLSAEALEGGAHEAVLAHAHPDDREPIRSYAARLLADGPEGPWRAPMEYRVEVPGKGWRWVSDSVTVIYDEERRAALAVGTVRDVTERVAGDERLRDLSRRLIRAQEDERRHMARELHDEIGQALSAVKMVLWRVTNSADLEDAGPALEEGGRLVQDMIAQVRDLTLNLRPPLLDDFGLVEALRSYAPRFALRTGLDVRYAADEAVEGAGRLAPDVETACYRIALEALTNAARHAEARVVRVRLTAPGAELRLVVSDDGCGFDVEGATARAAAGASLGLLGMRERAALAGGRLEVSSWPGRGTVLRASFRLAGPGA